RLDDHEVLGHVAPAPPVKKMTPVSMVPYEEGPRKAAYLVAQLQLTETGEQLGRFKPAALSQLLQARGGVRSKHAKQRIRREFGGSGGDLEAQFLRHVLRAAHEHGALAQEAVGALAGG